MSTMEQDLAARIRAALPPAGTLLTVDVRIPGKKGTNGKRAVDSLSFHAVLEGVYTHGFVIRHRQLGYRMFVSFTDLYARHAFVLAPKGVAESILGALLRVRDRHPEASVYGILPVSRETEFQRIASITKMLLEEAMAP